MSMIVEKILRPKHQSNIFSRNFQTAKWCHSESKGSLNLLFYIYIYTVFCTGKLEYKRTDPNDCSRYVRCLGSISFFMKCNPGLVFDLKTKVCNWPRNVDCTDNGMCVCLPILVNYNNPINGHRWCKGLVSAN